jgi:colanic acid biosynthesis glycosyl transferase WcaI
MTTSQASRSLRVLIVSQYFRPERVSIPVTLADELSCRGYDVEVITGWPNYPDGKLFAGFKQKLVHKELHGDVVVRRVPLFVSHSTSAVGRLLSYGTFAVTSALMFRSGWRADVVYVYATQMSASVGPALWQRFFGTPYVLHVQDLWPESITRSGFIGHRVSQIVEWLMSPWLKATYRKAAHVVAIAPTMLSVLRRRGAAVTNSSVILNWSPADVIADRTTREHSANGTTFVYAGNLGEHQDLPVVIEAFARCSDLVDLHLVVAGSGVLEQALKDQVARHPHASITFLGRLRAEEMLELNARSDFQIIPLKKLDIFRGTIPSKLQNALAAGVPVITTVHGDVTALVEREQIGFAAPPSDVDALESVLRLAAASTAQERTAMSDKAQAFYLEHMSEQAGVSAFEAVFRSTATPRPARTRPRTRNENAA